MYTVKFDTLKAKAKQEISNRLSPQYTFPGHEAFSAMLAASMDPKEKPIDVLEQWQRKAWAIVDTWDVRKAVELIRLFPAIVPKHLTKNAPRLSVPVIDYNERGEWQLMWP